MIIISVNNISVLDNFRFFCYYNINIYNGCEREEYHVAPFRESVAGENRQAVA